MTIVRIPSIAARWKEQISKLSVKMSRFSKKSHFTKNTRLIMYTQTIVSKTESSPKPLIQLLIFHNDHKSQLEYTLQEINMFKYI